MKRLIIVIWCILYSYSIYANTGNIQDESHKIDTAVFNLPFLAYLIEIDKNFKPSNNLQEYCRMVSKGDFCISPDHLMLILPELWKYLGSIYDRFFLEDVRAPRPTDNNSINSSSAIVGHTNYDSVQLLSLLAIIKKQIILLQDLLCQKFQITLSKLNVIEQDIFDTQTTLTTEINNTEILLCEKFQETWTILDNLTFTAIVDLSSVFTILDEINTNIIDTQTIMCEKFMETWTILQDISTDIAETFSTLQECCNNIEQDFQETWTILAQISTDIFDTQTTLTTEINNTETLLCEKFQETWTILDAMSNQISGVSNQVNTVDTTVNSISNQVTDATPIFQSDIPLTINTAGVYKVMEDLTVPASMTGITIAANDVTLDIKNHRISGTMASSVGVSSASFTRLRVINGCFDNLLNGVNFNSVTSSLLQNLFVSTCAGNGIHFSTCNNMQGINISSFACTGRGMFITGGVRVRIEHATFEANGNNGIEGTGSVEGLDLFRIVATGNSGNGIRLGIANFSTIRNCVATRNTTGSGISLDSTNSNVEVVDNIT